MLLNGTLVWSEIYAFIWSRRQTEGRGGASLPWYREQGTITQSLVFSFFATDSLRAKVFGVREDGLLYLKGTDRQVFVDAVAWCERVPGFRLAVFKKAVQYDVVKNILLEDRECYIKRNKYKPGKAGGMLSNSWPRCSSTLQYPLSLWTNDQCDIRDTTVYNPKFPVTHFL